METIRIKKGYNLNIIGKPAPELESMPKPIHLAFLPQQIPFVKPRLKVNTGDSVRIGSALIEDKRNSAIQFLSPGSGKISAVNFGARRVIKEIVIQLDDEETHIEFEPISKRDLEKISRDQLIQAIIAGGLWPLIRELPFRDYAEPNRTPPRLFVGLGSLEPFKPLPEVYLAGQIDLFAFGLDILHKLAGDRVYVCAPQMNATVGKKLNGLINLKYAGNYPAHDPGVLSYRLKSSSADNQAWYIEGQDVLLLARLLTTGSYPTQRIVSLGGPGALERKHFRVRLGAPLAPLSADRAVQDEIRYIEGGILTGYAASAKTYLGFLETALNLVPEGDQKGELLGLFRPGYRKPSFSRAFASTLKRQELAYDCNIHGADRACIACGFCAQVCPVDILPQFTYKAVLAGELEEALEHGLLDCVECGLCSYVCPSKIDLFESLKTAKADVYREKAR
jgi:Na+-transporting NADH:ubiquinone oxidoreductase subunit A